MFDVWYRISSRVQYPAYMDIQLAVIVIVVSAPFRIHRNLLDIFKYHFIQRVQPVVRADLIQELIVSAD